MSMFSSLKLKKAGAMFLTTLGIAAMTFGSAKAQTNKAAKDQKAKADTVQTDDSSGEYRSVTDLLPIGDAKTGLYRRYDPKINRMRFYQRNPQTGELEFLTRFKMSRHYAKTYNNFDLYTKIEDEQVIAKGLPEDFPDRQLLDDMSFFSNPRNTIVSMKASYNKSDSKYYGGWSMGWEGTVVVGKPNSDVYVWAGYEIPFNKAHTEGAAVTVKNTGNVVDKATGTLLEKDSYLWVKSNAKAGLGYGTKPRSPVIVDARAGFIFPSDTYSIGNSSFDNASPMVQASVGFQINPKKVARFFFMASATEIFPNDNYHSHFGKNKDNIFVGSVSAGVVISLGNTLKKKDFHP